MTSRFVDREVYDALKRKHDVLLEEVAFLKSLMPDMRDQLAADLRRIIGITPAEAQVLATLVRGRGKLCTLAQLCHAGRATYGKRRAETPERSQLNVYLSKMRARFRQLEYVTSKNDPFTVLLGLGYQITPEALAWLRVRFQEAGIVEPQF